MFRKFVFENYWSFCSAEFTLLLLFSEFLITALFLIYSSPSMVAKSRLRSFSSAIPSKCIHCLYTFEIPVFVWKVLYQGPFIFTKIYRISFTFLRKYFPFIVFTICVKSLFVIIFRSNFLVYWDSSLQWIVSVCQTKSITDKTSKQDIARTRYSQQLY